MSRNESFKGVVRPSYMDSTPWWPQKPDLSGRPNVLYILLDDTGYGDLGCYGSLIDTPHIDALAADGLRYTDFHVNAMCSPTRASLLTGCNHHTAGMGYIADVDLGFPSLKGQVGHDCGMISEILKGEGYSTFAVGKWHLVSPENATHAGPFDQWPCGRGFERFYGFLPAEITQFYPVLVNGNEYVQQPALPEEGYHFSEDMADRAIRYIGQQKSCQPDKPFFGYVAFGAHHSPFHVPKEYIERYRGKFSEGWDACRQAIFERQKQMGLIAQDAILSPNDYLVGDWDSRSEEEQRTLARFFEVYAGFVTHTDAQIGRIVDYLKKIGQYDNTLIVFLSDNGASPEGGRWGVKNTLYRVYTESDAAMPSPQEAEAFGSADTSIHYPTAWAHVSNTPFRMYKTWSYSGGMRVPCILSCPGLIKDKGGLRGQYHHVVDINATVLDILGVDAPDELGGVPQVEKPGISMAYTFADPQARRRRQVQYYELMGNRALWCDGWKAVADHTQNPTFDFYKDRWELYNTDEDPTEMVDLAERCPDKLRELVDMWWLQAGRYGVMPMLESLMKRREGFISKDIMKPDPQGERTSLRIYPEFDMGPGVRIQGRSYTSRVFLNYREGDEGVLYACGDNMGGYALYIEEGRLKMHYDWVSYADYRAVSDHALPEGELIVGVRFEKKDACNGTCHLVVNGEATGSVDIHAHPLFSEHSHIFSVGRFSSVAVTKEYEPKGLWHFTGRIDRVEFDLDDAADDEPRNRQAEALVND